MTLLLSLVIAICHFSVVKKRRLQVGRRLSIALESCMFPMQYLTGGWPYIQFYRIMWLCSSWFGLFMASHEDTLAHEQLMVFGFKETNGSWLTSCASCFFQSARDLKKCEGCNKNESFQTEHWTGQLNQCFVKYSRK